MILVKDCSGCRLAHSWSEDLHRHVHRLLRMSLGFRMHMVRRAIAQEAMQSCFEQQLRVCPFCGGSSSSSRLLLQALVGVLRYRPPKHADVIFYRIDLGLSDNTLLYRFLADKQRETTAVD